jgi:hypothetical protein
VIGVFDNSADIKIGRAAFFAPEITTSPRSGLPPITLNASKITTTYLNVKNIDSVYTKKPSNIKLGLEKITRVKTKLD